MMYEPELLLIGAVALVGLLHTIVPDHWVPITLLARQQGWTRAETARASFKAGTGHVLSTLLIALIVWGAGVAFAQRFGHYVDIVSSVAMIGFGAWIAISSFREVRAGHGHSHEHHTPHAQGADHHHHDHHSHDSGGPDHGDHAHGKSKRTALLLIIGSSPMVEGIPAFFAAGKYGVGLIVIMSLVFAVATIATYVMLCVYSTAGLQRLRLGPLERCGEVLSGIFIALVGVAFWIWPMATVSVH
jgi:ABC-type nickel/cobalt efflux system permease component RcnA